MKSGALSFNTPWNEYFNFSERFYKLSASLRETKIVVIEMHIREISGEKLSPHNFAYDSAISVVRYVDESHYIPIKNTVVNFLIYFSI